MHVASLYLERLCRFNTEEDADAESWADATKSVVEKRRSNTDEEGDALEQRENIFEIRRLTNRLSIPEGVRAREESEYLQSVPNCSLLN